MQAKKAYPYESAVLQEKYTIVVHELYHIAITFNPFLFSIENEKDKYVDPQIGNIIDDFIIDVIGTPLLHENSMLESATRGFEIDKYHYYNMMKPGKGFAADFCRYLYGYVLERDISKSYSFPKMEGLPDEQQKQLEKAFNKFRQRILSIRVRLDNKDPDLYYFWNYPNLFTNGRDNVLLNEIYATIRSLTRDLKLIDKKLQDEQKKSLKDLMQQNNNAQQQGQGQKGEGNDGGQNNPNSQKQGQGQDQQDANAQQRQQGQEGGEQQQQGQGQSRGQQEAKGSGDKNQQSQASSQQSQNGKDIDRNSTGNATVKNSNSEQKSGNGKGQRTNNIDGEKTEQEGQSEKVGEKQNKEGNQDSKNGEEQLSNDKQQASGDNENGRELSQEEIQEIVNELLNQMITSNTVIFVDRDSGKVISEDEVGNTLQTLQEVLDAISEKKGAGAKVVDGNPVTLVSKYYNPELRRQSRKIVNKYLNTKLHAFADNANLYGNNIVLGKQGNDSGRINIDRVVKQYPKIVSRSNSPALVYDKYKMSPMPKINIYAVCDVSGSMDTLNKTLKPFLSTFYREGLNSLFHISIVDFSDSVVLEPESAVRSYDTYFSNIRRGNINESGTDPLHPTNLPVWKKIIREGHPDLVIVYSDFDISGARSKQEAQALMKETFRKLGAKENGIVFVDVSSEKFREVRSVQEFLEKVADITMTNIIDYFNNKVK